MAIKKLIIRESVIKESTSSIRGVKELRDGLTDEMIKSEFPWLLKARFKDAVLGYHEDFEYLIWYDGTWINGTFTDAEFAGGVWKNGLFEYSQFTGGIWENGTFEQSRFYDGIWKGGTFIDVEWATKTGKWLGGYDRTGVYHPKGDSPDKWPNRKELNIY